MKANSLSRRLAALENGTPIIDDLAKFVVWAATGRNPNVQWDPEFKKGLEEAVSKGRSRQKS